MSDIYVPTLKVPIESERINGLRKWFQQQYATEPQFVVRVPGRVNIIGEHIDYCGYPVLPMAIEQCILLAVAPSPDDILSVKNINPKYKHFKTSIQNFCIELPPSGGPEWYNYFLCGVKGILEHLGNTNVDNGFMVAVDGNIPPAAGLSSSSALVSAAVLTTAYMYEVPLNKQNLATIAAKCERYIGTQGGGMDQAIAFLAMKGCAQYIEWTPLTATPVQLPPNAIFVIANSLTEANKAATHDFNQRVVECRLGCKLLAKKLNVAWREIDRFATLQARLKCSLDEMINFADTYLSRELYTREHICNELNIVDEDLVENLLSNNTKHLQEFKLRQRTLHVFQEALRVEQFRDIASRCDKDAISALARLMNGSHDSLNTLYECSHENLDKLVEIGRECGAGIRLTGAGWGGCVVALCDSITTCNKFINELKTRYYTKSNEATDAAVFMTSPQRGAEIFIL